MATNQKLMLETLSMDYHSFRKDQLLTDSQLNELIDYFEDQDRLSRTLLTGVGIVCGLGILLNKQDPSITVKKGCAITTDGDMVVMDTTVFRHFRPYINRKKGTNIPVYDPFFPQGLNGPQINLWEMVLPGADNKLPPDAKAFSDFTTDTQKDAADLVAMLYVEFYLQDPDKCTATDCDNQGAHQLANLRLLLLEKNDMDKVINRDPVDEPIADGIYKRYNDAALGYFNLPVLAARRVILNDTNTTSIKALADTYTAIPQTDGAELVAAVLTMYNTFKFATDPDGFTDIALVQQQLQQALAIKPRIYQTQYLYDFYKDILAAYNELRTGLFGFAQECCPDKYAFPKHIMLGELTIVNDLQPAYRHRFYPSPAVTDAREKLAWCRTMWRRIVAMIENFNIPAQPSEIKITPSAGYDRQLENRAIPFYYQNPQEVVKFWNFQHSRRGISQTVLSYNPTAYAGGRKATLNPLDYDTSSNDFFRIEGHLGKKLSEAMAGIDKIRKEKSVPFDLVALRLNKGGDFSEINTNDFDCQFEDLNVVLQGWLIDQNCMFADITRFFTGFTFKRNGGFHARIDDYKPSATPVVFAAKTVALRQMAGATFIERTATPSFSGLTGTAGATLAAERAAATSGFTATAFSPAATAAVTLQTAAFYIPDKTISGNLELTAGALGTHFAQAMKKPVVSADDLIAEVKRLTVNDTDLALLSAREKEIVYDVPVTLVAYANAISNLKPFNVNEINTGILDKYMELVEKLCAYVRKLESRIDAMFNQATYVKQGYENYYIFILREIISQCCSADKLETLMKEIEKRKQKILEGLLFANYAAGNPGLEHKAGVPAGGTFVMVYARELRTIKDILSENTGIVPPVLPAAKEDLSNGDTPPIIYRSVEDFSYHVAVNQGKLDLEKEIANFTEINKIRRGSLAEEQFTRELSVRVNEMSVRLGREEEAALADYVVVADFCLPYLCCSDCPPVTFVVPREQFSLVLPKASACNDEAPLEFRKQPFDGEVKTITPGFETALTVLNSRTFFDPSKVTGANLGKEAEFTINGQVTGCRITVMKHPTASFTVAKTETAAELTVKYTNTSDDATGKAYVYEWNFGDGRPVQRVDNKDEITIIYQKTALETSGLNGSVSVTLKASNGPCSHTAPAAVVTYTKEVPVSLSLPVSLVCRDANAATIPFTVQPANGVVKSATEQAAIVMVNNLPHFDPKKVLKPGLVINNFTVNDKPVTCSITVQDKPKPAFAVQTLLKPGTTNIMQVTFINQTPVLTGQVFNFLWTYSDKRSRTATTTTAFTEEFNMDVLKAAQQKDLNVTLDVDNGLCGDSFSMQIPFVAAPVVTCGDVVLKNIAASQAALSTNLINKYLSSIDNTAEFPLVSSRLEAVKKMLINASTNISVPTAQRGLINGTRSLLDALYASDFNEKTNDLVLTPCIKAMLQLSLDAVRCTATPDAAALEILTFNIVGKFITAVQGIVKIAPQLNNDDLMIFFIKQWMAETAAKDQKLLEAVAKMAEIINDVFITNI